MPTPLGTIQLMKNVPLDENYIDVFHFATPTIQYNFFNQFIAGASNDLQYIRYSGLTGELKVNRTISEVLKCNYLRFNNNISSSDVAYENKNIYAFIDRCEYVSDTCTKIFFTIDVINTYFFELNFGYAHVERCHVNNDTIGSHLEPEPVELGDYVYNAYKKLGALTDSYGYMVAITNAEKWAGNVYYGTYINGKLFYAPDEEAMRFIVTPFLTKLNSVIACYIIPNTFAPPTVGSIPSTNLLDYEVDATLAKGGGGYLSETISDDDFLVKGNGKLDGYTPKNNKLFTYPYNFMTVDDGNGNVMKLRYEYFTNKPTFYIRCSMLEPMQVIIQPKNYRGSGTGTTLTNPTFDLNNRITLNDFGNVVLTASAYETYMAQNRLGLFLSTSLSTISALSSIGGNFGSVVSSPARVAIAGAQSVASGASEMARYKAMADVSNGSAQGGNMNFAYGMSDFYIGRMSVDKRVARIIDDFFTMYGYAYNKIDDVNSILNNRENFTYVKTRDLHAKLSTRVTTGEHYIPQQDVLEKINSIFNSGVRFWWVTGTSLSDTTFLNYLTDNPPA